MTEPSDDIQAIAEALSLYAGLGVVMVFAILAFAIAVHLAQPALAAVFAFIGSLAVVAAVEVARHG